MISSLLIEVFIEELPFSGIKKEIKNIAPKFCEILKGYKIDSKIDFFWTPRRLILCSYNFPLVQKDEIKEFFGPPVSIAFDNGDCKAGLTNAGQSFIKKLNISKDELQIKQKDNKDCLYYKVNICGKNTADLLENIISTLLENINFGKSMQWGNTKNAFIRPIRNIFVILDNSFIKLPSLSLKYKFNQTNKIFPHKSKDPSEINNIKDYFIFLEQNGVIYSQNIRKEIILKQIEEIQKNTNIKVEIDNNLLDEIVAITEFPTALYGEFEKRFLELPEEIIITSMKINQKYFATYREKKLNNGFIVVCNTLDKSGFNEIVKGNMRVLKARLEDALFFYHNDLNTFNQNQTDANLKNIEFIQNFGNIFDKVQREKEIAKILIKNLNIQNNETILKAIDLSKNDLLSEIVGEFGELQGIMGSYYTKNNELKILLKEQYLPLQEDSNLPSNKLSSIVAIANKLDSIISLFCLNKIPSGSKDPFALRRSCSGIIKIILKFEMNFNLNEILDSVKINYKNLENKKIINFFYERLEGILQVNQSIINAAIKSNQNDLMQLCKQIEALDKITKSNDKEIFISLFKRVANILKNSNITRNKIIEKLLTHKEEKELYESLQDFRKLNLKTPMERIEKLLEFKNILQRFFDNVMINDNNEDLRENRILLVKGIYEEFFKVGDIREISF